MDGDDRVSVERAYTRLFFVQYVYHLQYVCNQEVLRPALLGRDTKVELTAL